MVLKRSEQAGESQVSSEVDMRGVKRTRPAEKAKEKGTEEKENMEARERKKHIRTRGRGGGERKRGGCDCWDCTHCWEYIDEGVQRGPFTNSEMRDWCVMQMLPKNLNIRPCDAGVSANRKIGGNRQVAFRLLERLVQRRTDSLCYFILTARTKRVLLLSERKNGKRKRRRRTSGSKCRLT